MGCPQGGFDFEEDVVFWVVFIVGCASGVEEEVEARPFLGNLSGLLDFVKSVMLGISEESPDYYCGFRVDVEDTPSRELVLEEIHP